VINEVYGCKECLIPIFKRHGQARPNPSRLYDGACAQQPRFVDGCEDKRLDARCQLCGIEN
jgi:hypothetical protein